MADASGQNEKNPVGAVTTPLRQKDPIATAQAAAARVEIVFRGPLKSPFLAHPVHSQVTVAARCTFEGGATSPIEKRAQLADHGGVSRLILSLTREQARALAAVEVWAEPYGHAAVLDAKNGKVALGRLRFDKPLQGAAQNHVVCDVHVCASVAAFIVAEMVNNVGASDMVACRRANESAKKLQADARKLREEAAHANFLKAGFMYQTAADLEQAAATQKTVALGLFAYRVHTNSGAMRFVPGGDWDHKPRIAPVWGEKNRLGDSDKVYFYDIWSNIHFGYVGRAAGFTLEELLGGSDAQQRVDHGADDESADKSSMREGYNLYDPRPGGQITVARLLRVVAAHDDWLFERRRQEWDGSKK